MSRVHQLVLAGTVAVLCASPAFAQATGRGGRGSAPRIASGQKPQGFSVVLVLGEMQGTGSQDTVPPAARKALNDMKDFLPYKSYKLLDTQWTLCCERGADAAVVSRLRGADDREYELSLTSTGSHRSTPTPLTTDAASGISIRFHLREVPDSTTPVAEVASSSDVANEIEREQQRLQTALNTATARAQQRHEVGTGPAVDEDREVQQLRTRLGEIRIRLAEANQQRRGGGGRSMQSRIESGVRRSIIDTSFTMDVGETVVVGTSRLKGDKALIALLTAVPANRSTR
jgi:hypothetical protein